MAKNMTRVRDITGSVVIVGGAVAWLTHRFAKLALEDFLSKSMHVQVADDAPAAVKLLLGNMDLSVRMQELYDRAKTGKPSPLQKYFKVTIR